MVRFNYRNDNFLLLLENIFFTLKKDTSQEPIILQLLHLIQLCWHNNLLTKNDGYQQTDILNWHVVQISLKNFCLLNSPLYLIQYFLGELIMVNGHSWKLNDLLISLYLYRNINFLKYLLCFLYIYYKLFLIYIYV